MKINIRGNLTVTTEDEEFEITFGEGDTPPVEEPEPTPEPEEPSPEVPDNVILGYPINVWGSGEEEEVIIPRDKIISSKFTTSSDDRAGGAMTFQTPTGQSGYPTDVWISESPGGVPVSPACKRGEQSFSYSLRWAQFDFRDYVCRLEPNTTYYLNMKHSGPMNNESRVIRKSR